MSINGRELESKSAIKEFENNFEHWVNEKSSIMISNSYEPDDLKHVVQGLVNAYIDIRGSFDSMSVHNNIETLMLFIKLTGASECHSNQNESLLHMEHCLNNIRLGNRKNK